MTLVKFRMWDFCTFSPSSSVEDRADREVLSVRSPFNEKVKNDPLTVKCWRHFGLMSFCLKRSWWVKVKVTKYPLYGQILLSPSVFLLRPQCSFKISYQYIHTTDHPSCRKEDIPLVSPLAQIYKRINVLKMRSNHFKTKTNIQVIFTLV